MNELRTSTLQARMWLAAVAGSLPPAKNFKTIALLPEQNKSQSPLRGSNNKAQKQTPPN